jgi:hypothetical protein
MGVTTVTIYSHKYREVTFGESDCFIKLYFWKSYLRYTISQEQLIGLARMAIKGDIAHSLGTEKLVATFAAQTARKVNILMYVTNSTVFTHSNITLFMYYQVQFSIFYPFFILMRIKQCYFMPFIK